MTAALHDRANYPAKVGFASTICQPLIWHVLTDALNRIARRESGHSFSLKECAATASSDSRSYPC
ncbi:hypothetical protein BCEP27_30656 [Burkholderia cepacia]